jgi:hypothetical protein
MTWHLTPQCDANSSILTPILAWPGKRAVKMVEFRFLFSTRFQFTDSAVRDTALLPLSFSPCDLRAKLFRPKTDELARGSRLQADSMKAHI